MENYQNKYLKYKTKYLNQKNNYYLVGGVESISDRVKGLFSSSKPVDFETEKQNLFANIPTKETFEKFKIPGQLNKFERIKVDDAMEKILKDFKNASIQLKADKETVLKAIEINWKIFQYANDKLKADKKTFFEAIKKDYRTFEYAHFTFKNDETIVEAMDVDWAIYLYASDKLKADKNKTLELVKKYPMILQITKFKGDKEVVLAAMSAEIYTGKFTANQRC
jgi:hypothetical protein